MLKDKAKLDNIKYNQSKIKVDLKRITAINTNYVLIKLLPITLI